MVFGNGIPAVELDVVACRRWAIQKADRLPVADFLDRIEVFEPAQLANADFIFIDAGSPDLYDRKNFATYAGTRWYGRDLTRWIQETRVKNAQGVPIDKTHFVATSPGCRLKQSTTGWNRP